MTITISKAIELLEEDYRYHSEGNDPDTANALKVSIGALKSYKTSYQYCSVHRVPLLPGETPEEEVKR